MAFREKILRVFRDYQVPVIELGKDNSREAVCLVFEKVNTGGVALNVFELITATYAAGTVSTCALIGMATSRIRWLEDVRNWDRIRSSRRLKRRISCKQCRFCIAMSDYCRPRCRQET